MKYIIFTILSILILACQTQTESKSIILTNHLGYQVDAYKSLVLQTTTSNAPSNFVLIDGSDNEVYQGKFEQGGKIDNWHTGSAYKADFSEFITAGTYRVKVKLNGQHVVSDEFMISEEHMANNLLPLLTKAFYLQRCKPPYDDKDKAMTFFGDRKDVVDVSGGWYDASGEKGKYLSHLSFSNYMTPQQLPMMVWNMLETIDVLKKSTLKDADVIIESLKKELVHGADYLVRIQDEEGYFYATIFAGWTKDPEQREICAYEGQDGKRNDRYQAAFREGGGVAIAALARTAKSNLSGEFSAETYLKVALKGYAHLKENNLRYADDGKENIIDEYCALLAAIELYQATADKYYLSEARAWSQKLQGRLVSDDAYSNWLRSDEGAERPFFHGAEAGLPIIALSHYLTIEKDAELATKTSDVIVKLIQFELSITNAVNNPFGYARQYVKAVDEAKARASFFIPHKNETGYWWQGENARIASLATAVYKAQPLLSDNLKSDSQEYAQNQLNWVLGLNPYNVCMLHGAGRNNPDYKEDGKSMNYLGGICNGITAGFDEESNIAFRPQPYDNDPAQRWRWSEQWLQHGGWFLPALAYSAIQ